MGELDEKKSNFSKVNSSGLALGQFWESSSEVIWLGQVWTNFEQVFNVPSSLFHLIYSPSALSSPFSPRIMKLTQIWE